LPKKVRSDEQNLTEINRAIAVGLNFIVQQQTVITTNLTDGYYYFTKLHLVLYLFFD